MTMKTYFLILWISTVKGQSINLQIQCSQLKDATDCLNVKTNTTLTDGKPHFIGGNNWHIHFPSQTSAQPLSTATSARQRRHSIMRPKLNVLSTCSNSLIQSGQAITFAVTRSSMLILPLCAPHTNANRNWSGHIRIGASSAEIRVKMRSRSTIIPTSTC